MNPGAESLSFQGHGLLDRRGFLGRSATALGSVALTHLLGREGLLAAQPDVSAVLADLAHPNRPRPPHYPPTCPRRTPQVLRRHPNPRMPCRF